MVLTSTLRLISPLSVLFCLVSLYTGGCGWRCEVFNWKGINWYDNYLEGKDWYFISAGCGIIEFVIMLTPAQSPE